MSRIRKLSVMAGLTALTALVAVLFTVFGGSSVASAQESPRASDGVDSEGVPVVHDSGLDAAPRAESAASQEALQTCYAGAKSWDAGTNDTDGDSHYIPGWDDAPDSAVGRVPVYVASERCQDVNLRITSEHDQRITARVCFFPTNADYYCNQGAKFEPGNTDWLEVATGVQDGTRFEVELDVPGEYLEGEIAY